MYIIVTMHLYAFAHAYSYLRAIFLLLILLQRCETVQPMLRVICHVDQGVFGIHCYTGRVTKLSSLRARPSNLFLVHRN
jgi:hypothetical protein